MTKPSTHAMQAARAINGLFIEAFGPMSPTLRVEVLAQRIDAAAEAIVREKLAALRKLAEKWEEQVGWGGEGYDSSDQKVAWVREIRCDLADALRAALDKMEGKQP